MNKDGDSNEDNKDNNSKDTMGKTSDAVRELVRNPL